MIRWMFKIRNKLVLISLYIKIAWIRSKGRKADLLKNKFIIYTLFILLIALAMVLCANPGLVLS